MSRRALGRGGCRAPPHPHPPLIRAPPKVVIFVKSVQRCIALAQLLVEQNFPAIAIHRGMPQEERYGPGGSQGGP